MESKGFSSDWIQKIGTRKQWERYWMQQKMMEPHIKMEHTLIEMGIGNGLCSDYLKKRGYNIKTIDIDETKNPDIVCDLNEWKPNFKIDGFLSFQVFEHVPFETFEQFIAKLKELGIQKLYVSVPFNSMSKRSLFYTKTELPFIGEVEFNIRWPFYKGVPPRSKHHYWELNDNKISLKKYLDVYTRNGYNSIYKSRLYYSRYDVFELI